MSKTKDILELLRNGYIPYKGLVPEGFYRDRDCRDGRKADWFGRPKSDEHQHNRYICLGCRRTCTEVDPQGFQLLLPIKPTRPGAVAVGLAECLTADQLLAMRRVLRVDEAAFILNVSRFKVAEMIDEGLLEQVPGTPTRVTVASVERNLSPTG